MKYIIYINSIIVFIISMFILYVIVKEKKSYKYLFIPVYMVVVVSIALWTQKLGSFGLLGFLGLVPFVKLYLGKKWEGMLSDFFKRVKYSKVLIIILGISLFLVPFVYSLIIRLILTFIVIVLLIYGVALFIKYLKSGQWRMMNNVDVMLLSLLHSVY